MFAIFGFHMNLVGYEQEIKPGDFTAVVYSDAEVTGSFTCSNELINKLVENSLWNRRKLYGCAVDCPPGKECLDGRCADLRPNCKLFYECLSVLRSAAGPDLNSTRAALRPHLFLHKGVHNGGLKKMQDQPCAWPGPRGELAEDSAGWGMPQSDSLYHVSLLRRSSDLVNQYGTAKKWADTCWLRQEPNPSTRISPSIILGKVLDATTSTIPGSTWRMEGAILTHRKDKGW